MLGKKSFAFVFPGQGSQAIGMLKGLADAYPEVHETFREASDVLGIDLWDIVQRGPEEELNRTVITQPALLATDVACYRVWRAAGGAVPFVMAGHSLGEYAALVCAESLSYKDGLRLVAERGRLMQEAVPAGLGAMAAVLGLADGDVVALCERYAQGEVLAAANYNAPGQVVIAGAKAAVDRAVAGAKAAGAKRAIMLPVSVPSHCQLMQGAAKTFAGSLAEVTFHAPLVPVIHNCHVLSHHEPKEIRAALIEQLFSPVRWVESVQHMVALGARAIIECGPGRILTGLNKRIVDHPCLSLGEPADLLAVLGELGS